MIRNLSRFLGAIALLCLVAVACNNQTGQTGDEKSEKDSNVSKSTKAEKTKKSVIGVAVTMSETEKDYLIGLARDAFETWVKEKGTFEPKDVPESLKKMKINQVFATIYKKGEWRGCVSAKKGDVASTVVQAVINTARDRRFENPRADELSDFRVELSFLQPFELVDSKDPVEIQKQLEPGVHGISLEHKNGRKAFFLPYVFVKTQRDTITWLERICAKAGLPKDAWKSPEATIYRYNTINFIEDKPRGKAVDLYRYKVELDSLPEDALPSAIALGSKYFISKQKKEGNRFEPGIDQDKRPLRKDSLTIQLLTMAALGNSETKETFKSFLSRVYGWFLEGISKNMVQAEKGLKIESDDAKSLEATLAFAEFVLNTDKLSDRAKLAKAVGAYLRNALDPKTVLTEQGEIITDLANYAVLTMARLALLNADSAEKAHARQLFDGWWRGNQPWSLAALAAVYALDPSDTELYTKLLAEVRSTIEHQITPQEATYSDYIGAFDTEKVPTAVGVSVYLRGLAFAYPLIKTDDGQYQSDIAMSAMFASRWLLEQQFTEISAFYIEHYEKLLGAFKHNILINSSRLDDTAMPLLALTDVQAAMGEALSNNLKAAGAQLDK
jgi:AmmeMemoRadiSam system protein A